MAIMMCWLGTVIELPLEKHKCKLPGNLHQNLVSEHSAILLNLTQLAYMKTEPWKGVYAVLLHLAVNLDYSKYLAGSSQFLENIFIK